MVSFVEGKLSSDGLKFALVVSRFNSFITDRLVEGAVDAIVRTGGSADDVTVYKVPGAFEIPLVAKQLATSGDFDGICCIGAVIRGQTPHFEFVSSEVAKGCAQVSMETGKVVAFGVLTTDTLEQAVERAGSKAGNKGSEAAMAMIETVNLLKAGE